MGVRGWVMKSDVPDDLMAAVEALQRKATFFTPFVANLVLDGCLRRWEYQKSGTMVPRLTPREREVVQILGEGGTTQNVATVLGVSLKTAETHRSNIMQKLGFHAVAELVLYAVRNEIVHLALPGFAMQKSDPARNQVTGPQSGALT